MKEVLKKTTLRKACWSLSGFSALLVQSCIICQCAEELCAEERSRIIMRVGTHGVIKVSMKYFVLQPAVSWHKLGTILVSPLLYHTFNLEAFETTQQDEKTASGEKSFFMVSIYFCNIWMQNKSSGCILLRPSLRENFWEQFELSKTLWWSLNCYYRTYFYYISAPLCFSEVREVFGIE